jgi:hypothetical protein
MSCARGQLRPRAERRCNRHPPRVDLDVTIDLGPALFDRIDWATFPDGPGRGLLAEALIHTPLEARFRR